MPPGPGLGRPGAAAEGRQANLRLRQGARVLGRLRHFGLGLPVEGACLPGEIHQGEGLLRVLHLAASGEEPRPGQQVRRPRLGAKPLGPPFEARRTRQIAGEQGRQGLLLRLLLADEVGEPLQGRGFELAAGHQAAVESLVEEGLQALRGLRIDRTRRAAIERLFQELLEAGLGPRPLGDAEVQRAGLLQGAVAAQPVGFQQVAVEAGEQRLVPAAARRVVARPVAAPAEDAGHLIPGGRVVRQRGEGLLPVGGAVEPGLEEPAALVRVTKNLCQEAAGDGAFARRQRRPDLQVRGGEQQGRLAAARRQADGCLQRRFPAPVGGEQPRIVPLRPTQVGGGAHRLGRLPRGGPPGQNVASHLCRLRHALRGLGGRLLRRQPLAARRVELRRDQGARRAQPHPVRLGLAVDGSRVEVDVRSLEPAEPLVAGGLQTAVLGADGESETEGRQYQSGTPDPIGAAAPGRLEGSHGEMVPQRGWRCRILLPCPLASSRRR